jgi:hypothetical protein
LNHDQGESSLRLSDWSHSYVNSIYPSELEIKDTTESSTSGSYLDVLLNIDAGGKLTTQWYDKQVNLNFAIVNFPYTGSNIPQSPVYGVYISQLIRCKGLLYKRSIFKSDRQVDNTGISTVFTSFMAVTII